MKRGMHSRPRLSRACSHLTSSFAQPPAGRNARSRISGAASSRCATSDNSVYVGWRLLGTDPAGLAFNLYRATGGRSAGAPQRRAAQVDHGLRRHHRGPRAGECLQRAPGAQGRRTRRQRAVRAAGECAGPAVPHRAAAAAAGRQRRSAGWRSPPRPSPTARTTPASPTSTAMANTRSCSSGIRRTRATTRRRACPAASSSMPTSSTARCSGASISAATSAPARTTRSSWSTTSTATAAPRSPARPPTAPSTALGTVIGDASQGLPLAAGGQPTASRCRPPTTRVTARCSRGRSSSRCSTASPARRSPPLTTSPAAIPSTAGAASAATATTTPTATAAIASSPAVAYLDGELPSVIMARGYYGRSVLAAWDYRNGQLTSRWVFDPASPTATGFPGAGFIAILGAGQPQPVGGRRRRRWQGRNHLRLDGRRRQRRRAVLHGTAARRCAARRATSVPSRPGLEVYGVHESEGQHAVAGHAGHGAVRRARRARSSGASCPGEDVGRGMAADIDPRTPGYEFWGAAAVGLLDGQGNRIADAPTLGEPRRVVGRGSAARNRGRQLDQQVGLEHRRRSTRLLTADGAASNNGTKAERRRSPRDILGDWREEVIFRAADNLSLRIYTTTIPADEPPVHADARSAVPPRRSRGRTWPTTSRRIRRSSSATAWPHRRRRTSAHLDTDRAGIQASLLRRRCESLRAGGHPAAGVDIKAELVDLLDDEAKARIVSVTSSGDHEQANRTARAARRGEIVDDLLGAAARGA